MIENFIRFMCGYLYISIKGDATTRFINLCNGKDMLLWGISKNNDKTMCYISLKNYRKVRPLARKCKVLPYIKRRYGFPFILQRILKRKILFYATALFAVLIYIMSLYLWNISFEGNYLHTKEQLLMFLSEMDVKIGSKKSEINCSYIEEMIRKNYPDIGWVSVELKGTRLFTRIEETTIPKSAKDTIQTNYSAAHLVATKDGMIQSVLVRTGTSNIKAGDIVKKGDILVSGIINVIGDDQTIHIRHNVLADADIIMKTTELYNESFSMSYEKKIYSGNEKSGYEIYTFGNKIFSYYPSNSFSKYDIISEDITLKMNKDFYLPFAYKKVTFREYYAEQMLYTEEEAKKLAQKNLIRYLEAKKLNGAEILSYETETKIEGGVCTTTGRINMLEKAYEYNGILEANE